MSCQKNGTVSHIGNNIDCKQFIKVILLINKIYII